MLFDLRRYASNFFFPAAMGITILFFAAGYGFRSSVSPDGVELLPWLLDTYTCYTQFGPLVITALAISAITADFSAKNCLFYRGLGLTAGKYCLSKLVALVVPLVLGTSICLFSVCLFYGDFSSFIPMLLHFASVSVSYLAFASLLAVLFGSFIASFFANVSIWIVSTFFVSHCEHLWFLAPFDQNSHVFLQLVSNMADPSVFASLELQNVMLGCVCALLIASVSLACCALLDKRWVKNGI